MQERMFSFPEVMCMSSSRAHAHTSLGGWRDYIPSHPRTKRRRKKRKERNRCLVDRFDIESTCFPYPPPPSFISDYHHRAQVGSPPSIPPCILLRPLLSPKLSHARTQTNQSINPSPPPIPRHPSAPGKIEQIPGGSSNSPQ